MGQQVYAPRQSNPKGFFEDAEVNRLNEDILARLLPSCEVNRPKESIFARLMPWRPDLHLSEYGWDIPNLDHRWLARIPITARAAATSNEIERIRELTRQKPFCFKDPRFCYTIDLWRGFGNTPKFICVFRNPAAFVASVFTECLHASYLHPLAISVEQVLDVWVCMYRHVLERHSATGEWIFVQYEELLAGKDLDRIATFTGVEIDRDFPDPSLKRSQVTFDVPPRVRRVFDELKARTSP